MQNLVRISKLRRLAQHAGLSDVVALPKFLRIAPADLPDSMQVRLQRMYPGARIVGGAVTVPWPQTAGEPLADTALIEWVQQLLGAIWGKVQQPAA